MYTHACVHVGKPFYVPRYSLTHLPHPSWNWRSPNCKNSIKCEEIKIIEFCLKIYDPWTLLHTFRLGLMCRQGGVSSKMALLCFGPKKVHVFRSCDPLIKNVPIFALDNIRPYLDWALRGFLTSQSIYDPLQIWLEMKSKVQNLTKMSICHRTINHKNFKMYPQML